MSTTVIPGSLASAPSLIEHLLPVQKLSVESYKEQMAVHGKTLTALGSYWKGRKPLILNKACVLGCLLPATDDPARDLEIFEKLMGMDDESFVARAERRPKPAKILETLSIAKISDYFVAETGVLPTSAPVDWSDPTYAKAKVTWRKDLSELDRRRLEAQMLPKTTYRERVSGAKRPEEVEGVHDHIWEAVNAHMGTDAHSFPELIEQLGIMRFGRRPRVADVFCGSGQIPFEAARLGADVYASDLNPVACMLTWGAFNIVGGSRESREQIAEDQAALVEQVQAAIDGLGVETDGTGWRAKVYLYCVEAKCPETGWMVPLLPTLVVSRRRNVIADLVPDVVNKCYEIRIRSGVGKQELDAAEQGTVRSDGRGHDPYVIHVVDGTEHRTKISTLRGDYKRPDGSTANRLRAWEKHDFTPRPDDIYQERLYAVQWMHPKAMGRGDEYEFRSVTADDRMRERIVEEFIAEHLAEWQDEGWIPDMRIEPGYNTDQPIRERGWTYWHHLFNARQLLIYATTGKNLTAGQSLILCQLVNCSSRLSRWAYQQDTVNSVFDNQALNTLFNYGHRASAYLDNVFLKDFPSFPLSAVVATLACEPADSLAVDNDVYITDPPYGDAINYDEILEYFIAWLRKNPPPEFADWIWDSRRSLAIKGDGEDFRRGMVAAYSAMTKHMPDNGIQIIMFTHQSGALWADMANIVWAAGLRVTAAWYVATETDSALREGSYVRGTVLLVCRKRAGSEKTSRDDLAWEIKDEVEAQIQTLTGLNQEVRGLYRDENVFEDADLQMAGYAAALRVLTRYETIDGRDMTAEALRPRMAGETTFVDELIGFAVDTANASLAPQGITKADWDKLGPADRFYLKMLDLESRGAHTLDNYQNFAKAFKVADFRVMLGDQHANHARLKSAVEFDSAEMSQGSQFADSVMRAVLYGLMELIKGLDGNEVLAHLQLNIPNYYADMTQRELAMALCDYLVPHLEQLRSDEASAARVLSELLKNQRLG